MRIEHYEYLKKLVQVLERTVQKQDSLTSDETSGLFSVISDYTHALDILDKYDYQKLEINSFSKTEKFHATYENAMAAIEKLRNKFGGSARFANEKDDSFKSSMGQIYQTFGGKELYSSPEEKAAMLLYLVIKNHSFSDGNKRIAAMLFLWFLSENDILYNEDGSKRIANNTLVSLTLMFAASKSD